ncbi:lysophospholipid acyltransferase family protein [Telmatobacter bradus]|uniref:lysophospholipid acyltransferase family protein n=1 Tax=Telmatobacter bradus TaxID=474953 RepID=UPI003B430A90
MFVSLLVLVIVVTLSLPAAALFIPLAVLTKNIRPLYWVTCSITKIGFFVAGIRVEVEGLERVPKDKACIFMANHVSNLDPPALIPRLPGRTSAFSKRAIFNLPIFGYCLKLAEFIPVDRTGNAQSAKESVEQAGRVLAKGIHITTFVEGTRSRDGRMLPFKKGPFYLAKQTGALCVPISIYGTETLMAKGRFAIKPGKVKIILHEPIDPAGYETREALLEATRAAIASGLPEWMRA